MTCRTGRPGRPFLAVRRPEASVVTDGNVFGIQFHPEKSGDAGLRILRNFVDRCAGE